MFSILIKTLTAFPATAVLLALALLAGCLASGTPGPDELNPTMDRGDSIVRIVVTNGHLYYQPPQNIQDLVNRSHAIVIGTISAVYATVRHIDLEEVLLDDGYIQSHPYLLVGDEPDSLHPQIGERYLFALGRNSVYMYPYQDGMPGALTYSAAFDWMILSLQPDGIRNYDGSLPGYEGVTGEASFGSGNPRGRRQLQLPAAPPVAQMIWPR